MATAGTLTRYRDLPAHETDDENCEDMFYFVMLLATACLSKTIKTKKKTKKRFWVQPYLKQRPIKAQNTNDVPNPELTAIDFSPENFHMSEESFQEIASKIHPFMIGRKSKRPDRISDLHRLAITLDFLANSIQQKQLAQKHRVSKQVLGVILDEVCSALINGLKSERGWTENKFSTGKFLDFRRASSATHAPSGIFSGRREIPGIPLGRVGPECESARVMSEKSWLSVADGFDVLWNFPRCLGAIGGKYVDIEYPRNYHTEFTNASRIVVTGVADAHYRFIHCDVATCDGSETVDFSRTNFGKWLVSADDALGLPQEQDGELPFVFVTDDACSLSRRVMKAFLSGGDELSRKEMMFNDRLNHANLAIENAFGILASKWRCLSKRLVLKPDRAKLIVKACCVLHNYLLTQTTHHDYCSPQFADHKHQNNLINGEWRHDSASNSMLNSRVAFHTPIDKTVESANRTRQIIMNSFTN